MRELLFKFRNHIFGFLTVYEVVEVNLRFLIRKLRFVSRKLLIVINENYPHFSYISTRLYMCTVYSMLIFVKCVLYVDGRPVLVRMHSQCHN